VIDVFAEAGAPTLLNREIVYLCGDESCRAVYVTLVEDLMYRHDQEFGEGVEDCIRIQIGIHRDKSCQFANTNVSEEVGRSVHLGKDADKHGARTRGT
jgi:hypothetical protein